MTRLYLNDRGECATGPDNPPGYDFEPAGHVCDGCGIGWHVFPEPYHVETCVHCQAVIEREGTEWVHRDGGSEWCWDRANRRPYGTMATPAVNQITGPEAAATLHEADSVDGEGSDLD